MSAIKIFCKECGNDGVDHGDGSAGFVFMVFSASAMSILDDDQNIAAFKGHEPLTHPYNAIFKAAEDGELECSACGSRRVEIICEADLAAERKEQEVIDSIDPMDISDEVKIDVINKVPGMSDNEFAEPVRTGDDRVIVPIEAGGEFSVGELKIKLEE